MDESGNSHPDHPLIVGAVELGDDADVVEERIIELHRRLSSKRSLSGLSSFENFRKHGFHASTDPPDVSVPFFDFMKSIYFRAFMVTTDGTYSEAGETEKEKVSFMYEFLLCDLLIRHRDQPELKCYIEQSEGMVRLVEGFASGARRRAHEKKLGRRVKLPNLDLIVASKMEAMSMAIIDYVMLSTSRWIRSGFSISPRERGFREFREIEPLFLFSIL